jgi:hypothetical protein
MAGIQLLEGVRQRTRTLNQLFRSFFEPGVKANSMVRRPSRTQLSLESLEGRDIPSVTSLSNELLAGTGSQNRSDNDVASSSTGRTIHVWRDNANQGIYGRLLDASGNTVTVDGNGGEFLIEADVPYVSQEQLALVNTNPRVSMSHNGEFVVVWEATSTTISGDTNIRGKVFEDDGQLIGSRFDVAVTSSSERTPAVSMDDSNPSSSSTAGNFVVTWIVSTNVKAQRYGTSSGQVTDTNPIGSSFTVSQDLYPKNSQTISSFEPQVAMASGRMAFSWTDSFGNVYPNYPVHVMARSMNFSDLSGSDEFFIDPQYTIPWQGSSFPMQQYHTSVDITKDGLDYVITYHRYYDVVDEESDDPNQLNVWARTFTINSSTGGSSAATSAFMVNTYTTNAQINADVAMDASGNFVVTWESTGQDGSGMGVYARTFGYNTSTHAVSSGSEFLVNQTTSNTQDHPTIALSDSGLMTISWQFYDPTYITDIHYRRFSVSF